MTHRPTILQIIPRLDTGGAELSAIEITAAIVNAGGRAIVATAGGRMADQITMAGGELLIMAAGSKNPLRIIANAHRLQRFMAAEKVDLIHARSRAPAWSALIAARRSKTPFVTTYHGAYAESGRLKRLYNSVMVRSDIVIANSNYTSRLVQQRYGTPPMRIHVIHRGVDQTHFDPTRILPDRKDALRDRLGLAPGQLMIVQAARLTSWKGQSVLIDAAAILERSGKLGTAIVVLAGDAQGRDGYRDELRAQISKLGLDGKICLAGHIDDVPTLLSLAHVAVIASTEPEAFGRSVTEAGAMGCPAIATNIGAPAETVLNLALVGPERATGWLVAPGDSAALASCLSQALAMPIEERARMGTRARAHVQEHFSLASMKSATLRAYDELLHTRFTEPKPIISSAGKNSPNA